CREPCQPNSSLAFDCIANRPTPCTLRVRRSPNTDDFNPMTDTTLGISVCIITLDEADRIGDCIDSVQFCDEVIVVDSGSTDGTAELAAEWGAHVLHRDVDGYRTQKACAVAQASHDWVLCLDADERVTAPLRQAIEAARDRGFADAAGYR